MFGTTARRGILAAAVLVAGLGTATASPKAAATGDTKEFTACMRSHKLPDFPEVAVSSDGLINFDVDGERVDVLSEKYGAALKACQSLLPDGTTLPGAPGAPTAPSAPGAPSSPAVPSGVPGVPGRMELSGLGAPSSPAAPSAPSFSF